MDLETDCEFRMRTLKPTIFDFWADVAGFEHYHPADKDVLCRVKHGFKIEKGLPGPFKGRLRTAPVVLLALSPGYNEIFDPEHAASAEGQAYYARSRSGDCDLPSKDEHEGSADWTARVVRQFGVDYEKARSKIAVLNIGAYKSERFNDGHMLAALASSRAALDWAQSELFPEAEAGKRIVVCLRSARYWGLSRGAEGRGQSYEKSLFVPGCTPGGIMYQGELRDRIVAAVQEAVRAPLPEAERGSMLRNAASVRSPL